MPRSLLLGNGSMLATFDDRVQMRDFYYPYVGMEDHTMFGKAHKVGVHVEGKGFAWFSDESWQIDPQYRRETLVADTVLRNEMLGIKIRSHDFVHPVYNVLVRTFHVHPLHNETLTVRFFFNHDFYIYGDKQKDTAFYEPYSNTVIHYRGSRYFLVGGHTSHPLECNEGVEVSKLNSVLKHRNKVEACGISDFTVGKTNYQGLEGTWKDAEDGKLSQHTVEQGSVDSTVGIACTVSPDYEADVHMWLCSGKDINEVLNLHQTVIDETPERLERNCHNYWKSWVHKEDRDFGSLSEKHIDLFKRSLLIMRLHCDNRGGMLAAADADIMLFNKDTYTYVWPRDGAFVSLALDTAGYNEVTRRFFEFCNRIQMPDGYMLHKYNPNGSLGSSWHPWWKDGEPQLPIQEDETALPLYALHHHFECMQDFEFLQSMYESFVKMAAQFLCDFREEDTGLPLPSYAPWEEHKGVFTYTTACTIAGLQSAASICHILGHYVHSERYQHVADQMKQAMLFHLFDEEHGRFVKKIDRKDGQTIARDLTPDISACVVWKLGILDVHDSRVVSTMEQLGEMLQVKTGIGGLSRYTNDYYHSTVEPSEEIPGNPWVLTTLWHTQWRMRKAQTLEELEQTKQVLDWCTERATSTGMLPEQCNPLTGEHLSVSPLTWSHATYVETVLLYLQREKELTS